MKKVSIIFLTLLFPLLASANNIKSSSLHQQAKLISSQISIDYFKNNGGNGGNGGHGGSGGNSNDGGNGGMVETAVMVVMVVMVIKLSH
ncbi:hypothetical protein [Providencia heimbachae]|uniref:hypothetical protein n=1 Tax=Providencia heimbachae TaxID=333962 RepID=UPI0020C7A7D3|nr:hypothetical protein [Providencia heimbachae]